jgi:hypothetical protein
MCGAQIKKAATRCRFCGETLARRPRAGSWTPTTIDAGDILNRSWEIYKRELGLLIVSILIAFGIPFVVNFALGFIQQIVVLAVVGVGAGGPGGGNPNAAAKGFVVLGIGMWVVSFLINLAVQTYMQAGLAVFMLRVARGESPEIADLFSGMKYFWRFLWGSLLYGIMAAVGFLLLIVPGIFIVLMFWPFEYVIVDRNSGVIDSLQESREATSGNFLAVFLLALAGFGINLLGVCPGLFIGLLFTMPLTTLMLAVAYCGMTGQLETGESRDMAAA